MAKKKKNKIESERAANAAARAKDAPKPPSALRTTLEWIKSIAIAIALAMVIRWAVAEPYKIPSSSMETTLHGDPGFFRGDRIFVNKHAYGIRFPFNGQRIPFTNKSIWYTDKWLWQGKPPERWDIVVFRSNEPGADHDTLVKRVVGLPGDHILIQDGDIVVNGEALELPNGMPDINYTFAGNSRGYGLIDDEEHSLVPPGHILLLGDNSAYSRDGRWFGWMPHHHIIGEVTSIWAPVSRWRDFTGFTRTWWWIGTWTLMGAWILARLFVGRSVKVHGHGLGDLMASGEHAIIRFGLGVPIPFTRHRVGRGRKLSRGEVVLFRRPDGKDDAPELMLGIVSGLPNERVFLEEGRLQIDGKPVTKPAAFDKLRFERNGGGGKYGLSRSKEFSQVPKDHFYVLADGDGAVPDSRTLGWISRDLIVGPASRVWWPPSRARKLKQS